MNNESLTNRQKQAIETRTKIFDTTVNLINKIGFDKVTIRGICKEADVSTGTFYLYFNSKQDILFQIYKDTDILFNETDIITRKDLNSFEKIKELIKIEMNICLNTNIDIVKQICMHHVYSYDVYFFSEERNIFVNLNAIILEGQNNKELRDDMSSKDITWKILRFSRGIIYDWLIHDGKYDLLETCIKELSLYLGIFSTN